MPGSPGRLALPPLAHPSTGWLLLSPPSVPRNQTCPSPPPAGSCSGAHGAHPARMAASRLSLPARAQALGTPEAQAGREGARPTGTGKEPQKRRVEATWRGASFAALRIILIIHSPPVSLPSLLPWRSIRSHASHHHLGALPTAGAAACSWSRELGGQPWGSTDPWQWETPLPCPRTGTLESDQAIQQSSNISQGEPDRAGGKWGTGDEPCPPWTRRSQWHLILCQGWM